MSGFSVDWLRLREPYDHAARSAHLVQTLAGVLPKNQPLDFLELAVGFGSGPRFVAPRLSGVHRWTLLDHDPQLLHALEGTLSGGALAGHTVQTLQFDLRQLDALKVPTHAVFTQALLDLVSHDWLVDFADWLTQQQVPFLGALTVDGRVQWTPTHPLDAPVLGAFQAHQLGDRGFGASPGIRAAPILARLLGERGFKVTLARADWQIPPEDSEMLQQMATGIADAATEAASAADTASAGDIGAVQVAEWLENKRQAIETEQVSLSVGHLDLLAVPLVSLGQAN